MLTQILPTPTKRTTYLRRNITEFQSCIDAVEKCEKPVVVLLHGYAFGLAIDIALAADIRLCSSMSPPTAFCVKEVDIGLAADIGTLSRLPKAGVSLSWAKEVCLTAREFDADEALRVGFVSGLQPGKRELVSAGLRLATEIADKSPVAVQGTKELLNSSRDKGVGESEWLS